MSEIVFLLKQYDQEIYNVDLGRKVIATTEILNKKRDGYKKCDINNKSGL